MGIETRVCKRCGKEQPLTPEFSRQNKRWFEHVCKQCGRDATHAYHLAHQEEECAKARAAYWDDPEKERKRCREYMRTRRLDPIKKGKDKKSRDDYYERNKGKVLARSRDRYQIQAPIRRLGARNRYARRKGGFGDFTPAEIMQMFTMQKGKCWWCGKPIFDVPYGYDIDHRVPLSKGGSNDISNVVLSCPACNRSKRDKLPHEWSDRLL